MARRCLDAHAHIRGFAEFEGFCTDRFRPGTQSFKSAMFTNFITPAKGRTRFYHCLHMRSLIHAQYIATQHVCLLRLRAASHAQPTSRDTVIDFVPRRSIHRYNRLRPARQASNV
ncbi:hypothetical protein DIE15_12445 [Burkholderia sp. Bp9031]|nr:hypothetical protein DIE15_12445 [Burkholderia sp. Bp9031]